MLPLKQCLEILKRSRNELTLTNKKMKPLLLNYAIDRTGDKHIVYDYDYSKSLNVIDVNGEKIPFIDSDSSEVSLLTKTKVKSESDDDTMLHLKTKTEARPERDDNVKSLLELTTKTFTRQERDD